jgi:hypothetical protein
MGVEMPSGTNEKVRERCPVTTKRAATKKKTRWSQRVTETSQALELEEGVFTWDEPKRIARSLRDSAEESRRRKGPAFRSAMSMLCFYINRAGASLPRKRRQVLEEAKEELRELYGRPRRSPK